MCFLVGVCAIEGRE